MSTGLVRLRTKGRNGFARVVAFRHVNKLTRMAYFSTNAGTKMVGFGSVYHHLHDNKKKRIPAFVEKNPCNSALFHIENGDFEEALSLYDERISRYAMDGA